MSNENNDKLDPRDINDLYNAFENADFVVRKRYRANLSSYNICEPPEWMMKCFQIGEYHPIEQPEEQTEAGQETTGEVESPDVQLKENAKQDPRNAIGDNVQFFKIEKLVYDKNENVWDKLTTVYHTMTAFRDTSIVMLLKSDGSIFELYLGVADRALGNGGKIENNKRGQKLTALQTAFTSNFPGSSVTNTELVPEVSKDGQEKLVVKSIDKKKLINDVFEGATAVSSVSGIASLRSKESRDNEKFVQGMEKLADAMRGKKFSAIFIADCKGNDEIEQICASYEDIYSALFPFAQSQQTVGKTTGEAETNSFIKGVTDTTNTSVSDSISHSHTVGKTSSNSVGVSVSKTINKKIPVVGGLNVSGSYNHAWSKSTSDTDTSGKTTTSGTAKSLTEQNSVANSCSSSTSDGLQITLQNRAVKTLLDRIEEQIKHLRSCEAFGLYDFGCYFVAKESSVAATAASVYDSLMRGEESGAEVSSVCTWTNDKNNGIADDAARAVDYLKLFYHPLVAIPDLSKKKKEPAEKEDKQVEAKSGEAEGEKDKAKPVETDDKQDEEKSPEAETKKDEESNILMVTPSSMISGKEIAIQMGLPKKSIQGISVTECAEFGRNVCLLDGDDVSTPLQVGDIWHMRKADGGKVSLDANLLTSHVFITGSTGSGKSNTVYQLLDKLTGPEGNGKTTFLVVEPTKGEYKTVFGGHPGVSVYGTNYKTTELLRINPFSFPDGIQLYAHLDRLIEIFNACWPMYAAMPAVLKDAMERAYVDAGWDLASSENPHGRLFPNFVDVLRQIDIVMNESDYSGESKGDYKGALKTRLKSLTNGVYSQIFTSDECSEKDLFDKNVIVDLSEIGTETTSLIMGVLVLKLQEYRMASKAINSELKHITVLEEAHNLLKRTSTEQSAEGSNLVGKSVEMITNAIAEMRTYGECFMIVDQAPGALDPAAIRNTNTKIILRLPDFSDRELVGKAIALNDYQIVELSKLERGVAAVYQSGWIESVLCKFEKFENEKKDPLTQRDMPAQKQAHPAGILLNAILYGTNYEEFSSVVRGHRDLIVRRSNLPVSIKREVCELCKSEEPVSKEQLCKIAYELVDGETLFVDGKEPKEAEIARRLWNYHIDDSAFKQANLAVLIELLHQEHQRRENELVYGLQMGGVR